MRTSWPVVTLGEVLRHRKQFITIDDAQVYKRCRVQLAARGIVSRDVVAGSDIKTKEQQVCRVGDLLVAEIDAKQGGYGLVPPQLKDAIVSSHYFLFEVNEARLDRRYLAWFIKTPRFARQVSAQGSTNYAAIRPSHVLGYELPLPPLTEQRRVVGYLDAVANRIDSYRHAALTIDLELNATAASAFERITRGVPYARMGDVAPLVRREVAIDPDVSYPELGIRSHGKGTFHKPAIPGIELGSKRLFRVEQDDLVFNIVFAWEAAVAIATSMDHGRFGSHRFLTCVTDPSYAIASFLRYALLTPEGLQKLGEASPGGAGRNRTLGLHALAKIEVPLPSLDAQRWFDTIQGHVDTARVRAKAAEADLASLIPSILHRVFDEQVETISAVKNLVAAE